MRKEKRQDGQTVEEKEKEEKRVEATTTTWSDRHCVRETTSHNTQ
jgi:hypothetical protein